MPPKKKGQQAPNSMDSLYYQHYLEQTAKNGPNTAILLQVGKFYEMYDSVDVSTGISRANVQTLAELCGCAVEPKPGNDPTKTRLFWGFPESSLQKFERLLVSHGYTVVVIIQNKNTAGDVTSRTIDHISSPGTYWDAEGGLATRRDEQSLVCVYIEPSEKEWHVASTAFDIMTGKLVSTEATLALIDGKPVSDAIQPFWSMYPPAEAIIFWCSSKPKPKPESLTFFKHRAQIYQVDPVAENTAVTDRIRLSFFSEMFNHNSALSITEFLDVTVFHFVRRSLFHLLQFVKDHNPSYLVALHEHTIWHPDENVLLGNAALEQLGMLQERPQESLLFWLQKAKTAMGKRVLRERCLKPIADIEELNMRQTRIAILRADEQSMTEMGIAFKGMYDLSRLYRRFQLGNGTTDALLQMIQTYEQAIFLQKMSKGKVFEPEDPGRLAGHANSLFFRWNSDRIQKSRKQVEHGIAVGSFHPWNRGVFPHLDEHEDRWLALEAEMLGLKQKMEESIKDPDSIVWTLKEEAPFTFTTTLRRGVQIEKTKTEKPEKTEKIKLVKRGTSTTVTLECEAIRFANEKAIKIRGDWRADVDKAWRNDWAEWLSKESEHLEMMVDFVGRLDAECTLASIANTYGYVRPIYVESTEENTAGLYVKELRHPIIERIHTEVPYISHNLAFGSFASKEFDGASNPCGMLLYGVNAAGKSSLGKAIGLAVMMAQCGIPVPATEMTLIPYTGIFTRILGNDNLWAGMSSFVVEMTEFRSILRSAGPRTLVIGDELCAGTETASATAIVAAGVQTLANRASHFFFATHLHELADIPEIVKNPNIGFYHLTVRPDLDRGVLIYDRKLKEGCGSAMYGLEVCRGLDMDTIFLENAFSIRKRFFSEDGRVHTSRYNASVVVRGCSVCGSKENLETHHIIPQAKGKTISPGKHIHAEENLAVLCDACHEKHHRGLLDIQGWVQTSAGRKLLSR